MKPQDKNATLPGWGEWGGEDEQLGEKHKGKVAELELKRNIGKATLMNARADSKLSHVIINHDVDLVPSKHMLHMVPRPFADAGEFQRSMRQPIGPEWNTAKTFNAGVQPKVMTKAGVVIDPVDAVSGLRKTAKTSRRKGDKAAKAKKAPAKKADKAE
jgi:U3 small nucleolar RNA-associated protein 14